MTLRQAISARFNLREEFRKRFKPERSEPQHDWYQCVFHQERTASLKVNEKFFICFGCDAKGGYLNFLSRLTGEDEYSLLLKLKDELSIDLGPPPSYDNEKIVFADLERLVRKLLNLLTFSGSALMINQTWEEIITLLKQTHLGEFTASQQCPSDYLNALIFGSNIYLDNLTTLLEEKQYVRI